MFCRNCGRELREGSSFCPECGSPVGTPMIQPARDRGPGMSRRSAVAVLVFAVLALACVVVAMDMVHEDPEEVPTLLVSDDVLVYGDIADASEVMIQDTGDGLSFELLDVPDGTVSFLWSFTDRTGTDHRWTTPEPSVTVSKTDLTPGGYGVAIGTSQTADGTYRAAATCGMSLYGTVTDHYSWVYHGRTYSATASYDYRDCERLLLDTDYGLRTYGDFGERIDTLTEPDPSVTALEAQLRTLYLDAYGRDAPTDGQGYADFILAFVQVCFEYYTDDDLYGRSEYWAYPLETLYNGGGDCEDTTFLCAALYEAAGYGAGVFMVPGHAFAAVSLDTYTDSMMWGQSAGFHIFTYDEGGRTYYGCETTLDVPVPAGVISRDYTVSPDGEFLYMGQSESDLDGLYVLD